VEGGLEFAPFIRHRVYTGHYDDVQSIQWSTDSRFFLTASKDLTARVWSLNPEQGFVPTTLAGHRQGVRAAWFSKDQETVGTTVSFVTLRTNADDGLDIHHQQRRCTLPVGVYAKAWPGERRG
jgi:WD40 repeat protein